VYPPEDFQQVKKYGLPLMISIDSELNAYLAELLQQIARWIAHSACRRLVLLITDVVTERTLERWEINIEAESSPSQQQRAKTSEEKVRREIQAVMRQITACVSFLPVIAVPCAFDLLVYTSIDAQVPSAAWEPSDPQVLKGGTEVKLRSFTTTFHHVDTNVVYRE
jgi:mitotic spindle assembly checkpoint protein MAD2